ncbi:MAG: arginine repressor [Oscillospiraceae bacterium]|jgi:transcriptional regulator of arginine metabolism|nr:arginine repressor [Oscillospiraceae bacterium]
MKSQRQAVILQVVASVDVETQNQLIEELRKRGIASTQATMSRDVRELHLQKELTQRGVFRYAASSKQDLDDRAARLRAIFSKSVLSVACAQNIVVLKTLPGLANGACSALDEMRVSSVVGTLAGDDTAFLAMRDSESAERFCGEIERMIG